MKECNLDINNKIYIHVRVKTNTRKETIEKKDAQPNSTYIISVKEKAEKGQANRRIKELLAQTIGCNLKNLRLIKGATTPSKTYLLIN